VVVTPSTLVVVPSPIQNATTFRTPIPLIDAAPGKYAQWGMSDDGGVRFYSKYQKPSSPISRLVASLASTGSILPIQAPAANSSYSLNFYGPSISCIPANPALGNKINSTIDKSSFIITYVAFVPTPLKADGESGIDESIEDGDVLNGLDSALKSASTVAKLITYDSRSTPGHARLFLATYSPAKDGVGRIPRQVTECGLYNSSYAVDVSFINNQQSINVTNLTRLNGIGYETYSNFNRTAQESPGFFSAVVGCSLMDALSRLLVGYLRFASLYDGWWDDGAGIQILNTVLMETQELRRGRLFTSVANQTSPSDAPSSFIRDMTLAEAIEELSQNMTLSLFSNPYFL